MSRIWHFITTSKLEAFARDDGKCRGYFRLFFALEICILPHFKFFLINQLKPLIQAVKTHPENTRLTPNFNQYLIFMFFTSGSSNPMKDDKYTGK